MSKVSFLPLLVLLPEVPVVYTVCGFVQEFILMYKSTLPVSLRLCVLYKQNAPFEKIKAFFYSCDLFLATK